MEVKNKVQKSLISLALLLALLALCIIPMWSADKASAVNGNNPPPHRNTIPSTISVITAEVPR